MPWSGGSYTKGNSGTGGWAGDAAAGIGIEAGRHDTQDNDFATGINQCLNKDGSNAATANLNFGGYRPSNVAAGTAAAPAICAGNDSNTGMYSPSADAIGFANNGSDTLRITSTGLFGVATTTPKDALQVGSYSTITKTDSAGAAGTIVGFNHYYDGASKALATGNRTVTVELGNNGGILKSTTANQTADTALSGMNSYIQWGGAADNILFATGGTERMQLTSAGYLSVTGPVDGTPDTNGVHIGTLSNYSAVELTNSTGGYIDFNTTATDSPGRIIYTHADNKMKLNANSNIQLTVDGANSRIGIGTDSPSYKMHVYAGSGTLESRVESGSLANNESSSFRAVVGGRESRIFIYKHSGITNPVAVLGIDQEDGASSYIWADNGNLIRTSTTITNVGTTGGTVVGDQTSDERLKDVSSDPFPYGLTDVLAIQPVSYKFKNDADQKDRVGFIAQQILPIIPESVYDTREEIDGEPEGAATKLAMDYTSIIPVLVKAVQELNAKVEALEARIDVLES